MCLSETCCGRFLICFFILLISTFCWILFSADYGRIFGPDNVDPPLFLETNRLPLISSDRKIIYVASEEGLPVAHNFILRNPSIPIEKIVFRKPGVNSTIHVYAIQREGLIATNDDMPDFIWIGICTISVTVAGFVLFIVYVYVFKDIWKTYRKDDTIEPTSCDGCCNVLFDTSIDILDDPFDSPMDSPLGSPIKAKPKKDWKLILGYDEEDLDKLLAMT